MTCSPTWVALNMFEPHVQQEEPVSKECPFSSSLTVHPQVPAVAAIPRRGTGRVHCTQCFSPYSPMCSLAINSEMSVIFPVDGVFFSPCDKLYPGKSKWMKNANCPSWAMLSVSNSCDERRIVFRHQFSRDNQSRWSWICLILPSPDFSGRFAGHPFPKRGWC